MALTRSFKELVQRHVVEDPAFGEALLREGIDTMLSGDVDTGKAICATTLRRRSASRSWARRPTRRRRVHPHVRAARQSAGPEPLQRARLPAEAGWAAAACDSGTELSTRPWA